MARSRLTPSCPNASVVRPPPAGKRLAHLARGDGFVDKSVLVARGVSPLRRDEPALLLDAAGTSGFASVRCVSFHLPKEVGERAGGAERCAI